MSDDISVRRRLLERLRGGTSPWDLLRYFRDQDAVSPEVKTIVERIRKLHESMSTLVDISELVPGTEANQCIDLMNTLNDHISLSLVPQIEKLLKDGKKDAI